MSKAMKMDATYVVKIGLPDKKMLPYPLEKEI